MTDEPASPDPRDRRDDGLQDTRDDSDPGSDYEAFAREETERMRREIEPDPHDASTLDVDDYPPCSNCGLPFTEQHEAISGGRYICLSLEAVGTLDVDDDGLDPITGRPPHWRDR